MISKTPMETIWHLRVRAVIEHEGKFLAVVPNGRDRSFLPGGHVETGETVTAALARELKEELGIACTVGKYLGAIESAWVEVGAKQWEITHFFHVEPPAEVSNITAVEDGFEMAWLSPDQFQSANLLPMPLRELLAQYEKNNPQAWWASAM